MHNWGYAAFVQDDWRVTRTLTLNLGLRYELSTVVKEEHNLLGNFDPTVGLEQVGQQISSPYNGDHTEFAPCVGFAWDVTGKGTTVLRGGGGLMYETLNWESFLALNNSLGIATIPTGAVGVGGNGSIAVGTVNFDGSSLNWDPSITGVQGSVFRQGTIDCGATGQSPIKVSETADRMLSRVIDYVQTRPEIDQNRIAVHGVSWGAYWATKLAIVERARLRGASAQSPPVDAFFQKEFLMNSLLGNREYLFDQVPALMNIFAGVNNLDELAAALEKMSLVKEGLLGKPMAPMLILAGVKDTQVPISDIYLLLSKGDVPKTAWINPQGGHLGRQVKVWPDPVIFKQVIIPWLVRTLEARAPADDR